MGRDDGKGDPPTLAALRILCGRWIPRCAMDMDQPARGYATFPVRVPRTIELPNRTGDFPVVRQADDLDFIMQWELSDMGGRFLLPARPQPPFEPLNALFLDMLDMAG